VIRARHEARARTDAQPGASGPSPRAALSLWDRRPALLPGTRQLHGSTGLGVGNFKTPTDILTLLYAQL